MVTSGWALLLRCGSISQSTNALRASHFSRVEIRLLRDTRRELEYLPEGVDGQLCVYDMDETTRR